MPQRLEAPGGVGVVVGVALEVVEKDVRCDVVRVPAVLGLAALIAPVLALLAQQAVVLEVVDDLEQRRADDRLQQQPGQDLEPEDRRQARKQDQSHRPRVEHVVLQQKNDLSSRSRRSFSRWIADVRLPHTVRGRNSQKLSPRREEAGSSGVATRTWWPRLCSMKKWP